MAAMDSPFSPPVRAAADAALAALGDGRTGDAAQLLTAVAQEGTWRDAVMAAEIVLAAHHTNNHKPAA
ncbi:hypothetical protein [Streptomyces acidicola]|uniref:Uncharacterized protein n=1 Tax=Streptomyces acidicola TaxID=2596892 RepID=A0A5N8WIF6_9ACTN|nr:hypothetical protein [Streptomyces acidicola]MPY47121.1 hypothetical protein [Streptomyces acidicola]MPY47260.1 hypothetical protein [Streptomyces acidicola]